MCSPSRLIGRSRKRTFEDYDEDSYDTAAYYYYTEDNFLAEDFYDTGDDCCMDKIRTSRLNSFLIKD